MDGGDQDGIGDDREARTRDHQANLGKRPRISLAQRCSIGQCRSAPARVGLEAVTTLRRRRASTRQHRLADHLAVDHRLHRLGRLRQRETMRNARLQPALCRELVQCLHVGDRQFRIGFVQTADAYADRSRVWGALQTIGCA